MSWSHPDDVTSSAKNPADIANLLNHYCYSVFKPSGLMSNIYARYSMEKSKGHWTFRFVKWISNCPLDPMDK
jgi:hypothetical protein